VIHIIYLGFFLVELFKHLTECLLFNYRKWYPLVIHSQCNSSFEELLDISNTQVPLFLLWLKDRGDILTSIGVAFQKAPFHCLLAMLDMVGLHMSYQARGVAALRTYAATETEYACNTALLIWMCLMMEYLEVTPHGRLNSSS
jgi:hypothetical protein